MVRSARVVVTGTAYHLTHRGNERRDVFFNDLDRRLYLADLAVWAHDCGLRVWGYCLMTNHVHMIAVPTRADSLARAVGRVHQRHARRVHARQGSTGHLWANRFFSAPLDGAYLWAAIRYVELNPVRAGLVARAKDWPWSSAGAHGGGVAEGLDAGLLDPARPFGGTRPHPRTGAPIPWDAWLAMGVDEDQANFDAVRLATSTGRPCGGESFKCELEKQIGRSLTPKKPGPKPKAEGEMNHNKDQIDLFEL